MSALAVGDVMGGRGTFVQRSRASAVSLLAKALSALPSPAAAALADAVGTILYHGARAKRAQTRRNFGGVAAHLAGTGMGPPWARAAASDPAALERLVRAVFRHYARSYVDILRATRVRREAPARTRFDTPAAEAAFSSHGSRIFVTAHYGAMDLSPSILVACSGGPMTTPMETIADPALQRVLAWGRSATGIRLVGLREARRELAAALARGEAAGLVAERNIAGGGVATMLFGAPAPLPVGPALLAVDSGAPLHVAMVRRADGGYRVALETVPAPPDGSHRERVQACLAAEARAIERLIAIAPEQWWGAVWPIWPDLSPGGDAR